MSQLRFLEYTPSNRAHCGKCRRPLDEGELRFGTEIEIQGRESVAWRCIHCVTKKQAENLRDVALQEKVTLKEKILAPPPPSAGGDGPDAEVLRMFVMYLKALIRDDTKHIKLYREFLESRRKPNIPSSKIDVKHVDTHILDAQLKNDLKAMDLLTAPDLTALCQHHNLPVGTKIDMEKRLRRYYSGS